MSLTFLRDYFSKQGEACNKNYILCAYIGTVKFATQLKESPCSPVVTFPSFGSEGHGVQPPQGDSFFIFLLDFTYLFRISLAFCMGKIEK